MHLPILDSTNPKQNFPDIETALTDPDGLLAMGGCLSPQRIVNAYKAGIFPWYSPGEAILWWSPNPRLILMSENLMVSRSLKKTIRRQVFKITFDQAFAKVMKYCAAPRDDDTGTWISKEMTEAYIQLHQQGIAHSVEAWFDDELVGGLYGIAIGQVFYGESMFHKKTDASKVAFCHLVQHLAEWGYQLIDCQVHTNHLASLGATEINRTNFITLIKQYCSISPNEMAWK